MNKIVILGNTGFIGRYFNSNFSKIYEVYGFSSSECNLLIQDDMKRILNDFDSNDILIICSSITRLYENSQESMNKNILMIQNVSNILQEIKFKQVVFLSTIDVYGISIENEYIDELTPLNPNDYYATSKVVSEFILKKVCSENNIKLFIARLSGVYGVGDKNKSTMYSLVSSAIKNKKIILYNNGSDKRDFISVEYLYNIILNSIKNNYDGTLNIATGKSFTIKQIALMIQNILSNNIKIEYKITDNIDRINDIKFDISKLEKSNLNTNKIILEQYLSQYIKNNYEN